MQSCHSEKTSEEVSARYRAWASEPIETHVSRAAVRGFAVRTVGRTSVTTKRGENMIHSHRNDQTLERGDARRPITAFFVAILAVLTTMAALAAPANAEVAKVGPVR